MEEPLQFETNFRIFIWLAYSCLAIESKKNHCRDGLCKLPSHLLKNENQLYCMHFDIVGAIQKLFAQNWEVQFQRVYHEAKDIFQVWL